MIIALIATYLVAGYTIMVLELGLPGSSLKGWALFLAKMLIWPLATILGTVEEVTRDV